MGPEEVGLLKPRNPQRLSCPREDPSIEGLMGVFRGFWKGALSNFKSSIRGLKDRLEAGGYVPDLSRQASAKPSWKPQGICSSARDLGKKATGQPGLAGFLGIRDLI